MLDAIDVLDVDVGEVIRHRSVTVFPLFTKPVPPPIAYGLGARALRGGSLEVRETGSVDRLEARNLGRDRVLFLEGDHLVGANQNRVLTSSALVAGKCKLALPVACVEQGRWSGRSQRFDTSSTVAPAGLRRIIKVSVTRSLLGAARRYADQSMIWSHIADQQRRLHVSSSTRALSHTFDGCKGQVGDISTRFPYAADATGIAIGVAGELLSVDVFDKPATCAYYWRQLVEGAALESLGRRADGNLGTEDVRELLGRARSATWASVPPVGEGEELRADMANAVGAALLLSGRLVHLGIAPSSTVQSRPVAVRRDLPDQLASRYRIAARIGVGGAKEVFRATELATGRDVAIARVPGVDRDDFAAEVELAARGGEHTPRIYESLVDDDQDGYIVMDYCPGPNLAQLGRLSVEQAAPIMLAYARAIAAIHEAHVLHRDVKLDNAVLCQTDAGVRLKILDFGVSARASSSATAIREISLRGTLPYMASEVVRGQRLDARADVFSFAVCCYRLLTGELPVPPGEDEGEWEYMMRVRQITRHDLSRLPELPAPAAAMFPRMLDVDREHRPFMPEVVAAFERAFGDPPLVLPPPLPRVARPSLPIRRRIAARIAAPEHLLVASCRQAPLVALEPGSDTTTVRALGEDGAVRWSRQVEGRIVGGVRADLDADGSREIYLAGRNRIVALDANGVVRFSQAIEASSTPTLLAIPDRERPRIVVDGRMLDPRTGADLGRIPYAYQGDGRRLVDATDGRGLAYNGFALQCFRGDHGTGAAIVYRPGEREFWVAQLEEVGRRVLLAIYGRGGDRLHALPVADCEIRTGDRLEISRLRSSALFGPQHAPLAVLRDSSTAVVIVPLLASDPTLPSTIVAFSFPDARELWRTRIDTAGARAVIADLDGDGNAELVVGTGSALIAHDPWSGAASTPIDCSGLPVAFGDPFGTGFAHLITASLDGIELRRGPACEPGTMRWTGPRGDLWRTGMAHASGVALGPI